MRLLSNVMALCAVCFAFGIAGDDARATNLYVGERLNNILTVCKTQQDAHEVMTAFRNHGMNGAQLVLNSKAWRGLCVSALGQWVIVRADDVVVNGTVTLTLIEVRSRESPSYFTFSTTPVLKGRPL